MGAKKKSQKRKGGLKNSETAMDIKTEASFHLTSPSNDPKPVPQLHADQNACIH